MISCKSNGTGSTTSFSESVLYVSVVFFECFYVFQDLLLAFCVMVNTNTTWKSAGLRRADLTCAKATSTATAADSLAGLGGEN